MNFSICKIESLFSSFADEKFIFALWCQIFWCDFDVDLHITVVSVLKTNCKTEAKGKLGNE